MSLSHSVPGRSQGIDMFDFMLHSLNPAKQGKAARDKSIREKGVRLYTCPIIFTRQTTLYSCFLSLLGGTQGLLLPLHSGLSTGGAWRTLWGARDYTRVVFVQGKHHPHCILSVALNTHFSLSSAPQPTLPSWRPVRAFEQFSTFP